MKTAHMNQLFKPNATASMFPRHVPRLALVLLVCLLRVSTRAAESNHVTLVRTPDGGIQPQAAVDNQGVVHLIYFKGEPTGGDVFYVHRASGEADFSKPMRVNSQSG